MTTEHANLRTELQSAAFRIHVCMALVTLAWRHTDPAVLTLLTFIAGGNRVFTITVMNTLRIQGV